MPDQRVPPAGSPATANRAHARSTALDSSSSATPCNSGNTNPTAKSNPSSPSTSTSSSSSSLSAPPPQPRSPPPPQRLRISPVIIVLLSALAVVVLSALLPVLWFAVVPALSDISGGGGGGGGAGGGAGAGGGELSISSLGRGGNSGCVLASSSSSSFLSSSSSSPSLPSSSAASSSSSPPPLSSPPSSTSAPLSPSSCSSSSSLASLDYSRSFCSAAPSSSSSPSPSSPPSPSTSAASQSQPQSPQSPQPPQSSEKSPIVKQHYSNNVNANTDNNNNNNNNNDDDDSPHPHPHHNNHNRNHHNHHNASSAMTSTSVIVAATAHDDLNHVPTLPPTTSLSYLAEGAANVIYRLSSPPGAPQYPGQLLRLRKALPSAQPNKLAYAHLLHTFHPLFPDHLLLPTSLIRIPASLLVRENTALRALEAANKRPAKRVGLYLEEVDEQFGFLIMDMSPHPLPTPPSSPSLASPPSSPGFFARMLSFLPGRLRRRTASSSSNSSSSSSSKRTSSSSSAGSSSSSSDTDLSLPAHAQRTRQLLIEFKPKWVLQSRSAPDGWRRCRTCALRLSKHQKLGFCPLDLASGDEARVRRAVAQIVPARAPANLVLGSGVSWEATQAVIRERLVRYVLEGDLMVELKRLHSELDPYGPVAAQGMGREVRERFVSAMTVRDLTIFLRIDLERGEGEAGAVEARIGDLDLKTGEAGKWAYWAGVEAKLREEGYYGGTEEGAEEKGVWCRL